MSELLAFNNNISVCVLPPSKACAEINLGQLGKQLLKITVDKTNQKHGLMLFSLLLDPDTLEIIDVDEQVAEGFLGSSQDNKLMSKSCT